VSYSNETFPVPSLVQINHIMPKEKQLGKYQRSTYI